MHDTGRPPLRLGLLRVTGSAGSRSWRGFAAVVRVSNLLTRLNELNECLGNHAAVQLLEVLEGTLIVVLYLDRVSDAEGDHLI